MKKTLAVIFFVLLACSAFFASWFVLNKDLQFTSDIARDFLLFGEIATKKFILIGPKSSVAGLFHGPLWLYLNFPAYWIGNGNPVIVGWWWIILSFLMLIPFYFIAKKLFNKNAALLFVLFTALFFSFHTMSMFNPDGAMFCLPIFLYLFVQYLKTWNVRYLIAHIFVAGLIIQFELAIGIPLLILSVLYLTFRIIRSSHKSHLLGFLTIFIPLSTYILFDLRHQFLLFHGVLRYLSPSSGNSAVYNYFFMFQDRFKLMLSQVEFVRPDPEYRNLAVAGFFIFFLVSQIKNNRYQTVYFSFLYFYIGFYALTLINKGPVLYFYMYPFFPLVFLIFASFVTSKYVKLFLVVFLVCYLLNFKQAIADMQSSKAFIGKDQTSWLFLNKMANTLFSVKETKFGYFMYTPDIIGYGPRYALDYQQKLHPNVNAKYIDKEPLTYVVVAPPAPTSPYTYKWWKENTINLKKAPSAVINFPNGYQIEKYNLTSEEIALPYNHNYDPGLGFR
ncbi:MAG TPA: glycosyltransferase family 39 protein [Patescibacteria group bacterium]|nr:glycosyltransferase family 39 protein [Patescibacteria group bacterium]